MIPQAAGAGYTRSDEIYDENLVQFRLDICGFCSISERSETHSAPHL